ncbi:MAG TPA: MBL fold metallo-hydrolase [Phycisphaerae bacterium]|nr:MBL fold metallo-hydrolase [Phycisphaerae bacterium]
MSDQARQGAVASPPEIRLGDMTIRILDGGRLSLDGGAMFGIIPKPLWSRLVDVDDGNRIPLATSCFLVETGGKRILVESGCGAPSKYDEKERGFFSFGDYWILDSLAAIGVERESIDIVILTHMHFDHAGGGTMADGNGGYVPTFPRAEYVAQWGEWDDAIHAHAVMTGTYREENLAPLEQAEVLSLVTGDAEIAPGVSVRLLPGHTRHQQGVVFTGGGQSLLLPADLMPTSAHVGLRYNMAYDLLPFENMENKRRLLAECQAKGMDLLLGQDPRHVRFRLEKDEAGRVRLAPVG